MVLRTFLSLTSLANLAHYSIPDTETSEKNLGKYASLPTFSNSFSWYLTLQNKVICAYFILPTILNLSALYLSLVQTGTNAQSKVITIYFSLD